MKRRSNLLSAEVGLAVALAIVVTAFSVDVRTDEQPGITARDQPSDPITLVDLPQTEQWAEVQPETPRDFDRPPIPVEDAGSIFEGLITDLPRVPESISVGPPDPPTLPELPTLTNPEPAYDENRVFEIVEVMPELIGGIAGLQARIVYPTFAVRARLEGRVIVRFIVNADGSVSDAEVVNGIGGGCDEAALDAVRSARFTPGIQGGKAVRVRFAVPITFRLR